jgi:hypothetical protein
VGLASYFYFLTRVNQFWILDFGLTPNTRVASILDFGFVPLKRRGAEIAKVKNNIKE